MILLNLSYRMILLGLFFSLSYSAQNPRVVLQHVYAKFSIVKTYSVDVDIRVDLPYIVLQPIQSKLYVKAHQRFKLDTKRIVVLPRQGFLQFNTLITYSVNYTALFQAFDIIKSVKATVINVIPNSDTNDVILAKLWIDDNNHVIIKTQITTKSSGTVKTEYHYGSQITYGLPDKIQFEVDVKKFKIPKALSADINTSGTAKTQKKTGIIQVQFKNYAINCSINDAIFSSYKKN
jgi:hypothetical protein